MQYFRGQNDILSPDRPQTRSANETTPSEETLGVVHKEEENFLSLLYR